MWAWNAEMFFVEKYIVLYEMWQVNIAQLLSVESVLKDNQVFRVLHLPSSLPSQVYGCSFHSHKHPTTSTSKIPHSPELKSGAIRIAVSIFYQWQSSLEGWKLCWTFFWLNVRPITYVNTRLFSFTLCEFMPLSYRSTQALVKKQHWAAAIKRHTHYLCAL